MSQKPALLVMAAGMGSRYGGLKQLDPISPGGEFILDFSVYDALRAGFGDIVLVVKRALRDDFEGTVGARLRRRARVLYAYQDMDDLPGGFAPPEGRSKPWGTGHAVRAARDLIQTPFAVINADDFYGAGAFQAMADFLSREAAPGRYAMVGYALGNTLTDYGSVARGVCEVRDGRLMGIAERTRIEKREGGGAYTEDGGATWTFLSSETVVSMQFFGFHQSFMRDVDSGFAPFLGGLSDPMKGEYFLTAVVGDALKAGAEMRVLSSPDRWFGVTYAQDKPFVERAVAELRAGGVYPPALWE